MIAKSVRDGFLRALLTGEELKLPAQLWLGLDGTLGPVSVPRIRAQAWRWEAGRAVNDSRLEFDELRDYAGSLTGATLYDSQHGGEVVASFSFSPEPLSRRAVVHFEPGDLSIGF